MFRLWLLLSFLGALLGGAVADPGTVQAQGSDVDLAVSIAVPASAVSRLQSGPTITVTNRGSDPAYAVEVVIEADNISLDPALQEIQIPPIGSVVLRNAKLSWSITRLPGRSTYAYYVLPAKTTGIKVVQYVATVSSPHVLEPEHNNRAEVWQVRITGDRYVAAVPDYDVSVAVDNPFPQPGESVTFTITGSISSLAHDEGTLSDAQVAIPLPAGLTYSTHVAPAGTSYDSSTGIWTIDAGEIWTIREWNLLPPPKITDRTLTLTLTATRAADTVLNEQCVTAEISAKPPEPFDRTQDNRATVCLGAPRAGAPVLFQSGDVELWTPYPCVSNTTYPCTTADTVEVATVATIEKRGSGQSIKSSPDQVNVFIRVDPDAGRILDSHASSVTDANTVSWQTARAPDHRSGNRSVPGVTIGYTRRQFNDELANWDNIVRTVSVSGVIAPSDSDQTCDVGDPSPPCAPGRMKIRFPGSGSAFFDPNPSHQRTPFNFPNTQSTVVSKYFAEFSTLGTYVVDFTADVTHTNTNVYSGTHRSIFHVGPMADLAVRDFGPNPTVPAGQRAFTIMALNHGPDTVAGRHTVRVELPASLRDSLLALPTTHEGYYNETEGAWYLSNLQTPDQRRGAGLPPGPLLTLLTGQPPDVSTETVSIAPYREYTVCIGSDDSDLAHDTQADCEADTTNGGSWHTAPYYDLNPDNNTAELTARRGIQGSGSLTATETPTAVTLDWTPPVSSGILLSTTYTLQVSADGTTWYALASGLTGTRYTVSMTETLPFGPSRHYRILAEDADGLPGLPFATVQTGGERVITRTVIRTGGSGGGGSAADVSPTGPSRLRATPRGPTRLLLYWSGPRHLYGEAVTSYELEVSTDGDHWTTVAPYIEVARPTRSGAQPATKYTHTGLTPATTYHYRVYAHNRRGRSLASAVASATTDDPRVLTGYLENPAPGSFQSGLGMIHGWECDADEVVVQINGTPSPAVTGTPRPDTQGVCGDTDNGFEHLLNWNALGDGRHDVVVLVDGTELGRASVQVTTFGTAFLHGAHGTCEVPDFPAPGERVSLVWQEARQQFGPTDGSAPPTGPASAQSPLSGYLENPAANSFQHGLGFVSGWVCEAETVTLEMGGQTIAAHYGAERADTQGMCGDTDNGFSRLFNWPKLGAGDHEVIARADGVVFDRATVRVVELDIPADAEGQCTVADFPAPGVTATLTWRDRQQQFVVTTGE